MEGNAFASLRLCVKNLRQMKSNMTRLQKMLIASVFLGFFLIVSSIVLAFGIKFWISGRDSQYWQQTNGQLLRLDFLGSTGKGNRIIADYKYEVYGINYQNDRIRFGGASGDEKELQGLQNGDIVKIYFNPKNPAESVLIPGVSSGVRALTFFGVFLLTVIIAASTTIWFSIRRNEI
jgi:Protein of unknown function (DUF3592)